MGSVQLTPEELEEMLNRAARRGARQALEEIGLHDEYASKDIDQLRSLLAAWKDTKKSAWSTVVKMVTTGALLFIAGAVWMSFKDKVGH